MFKDIASTVSRPTQIKMSRLAPHGVYRSGKRTTVVVSEAQSGRKLSVELAPGEDGADVLRSKLYR